LESFSVGVKLTELFSVQTVFKGRRVKSTLPVPGIVIKALKEAVSMSLLKVKGDGIILPRGAPGSFTLLAVTKATSPWITGRPRPGPLLDGVAWGSWGGDSARFGLGLRA
jgi:hypothetical protein